ncbi:Epstein-Barr virus EBNA-1-like protein [Oryza sativa Japonica Group]|uniref:Epstein-Barr virus EBNA-1-like protein n=1 Tax=Oryza sativa subsp. japonica TaxID=39947 RepID=Q5JMN8_ORYSJ|nr:Epstein-Barr virus EBNA-1-like protein [Oryza sativa Japonica Group]
MRVRFKGGGASPGFKESVSGVGWGGESLRRAGDEQRPSGADDNGGEAVPGGDGAREWFGEVLGSSRTVVARDGENLGEELTGVRERYRRRFGDGKGWKADGGTRPSGGARRMTPRRVRRGRREGEVAPGAPRHAFTLAPAPPVLGDGRRRRERDKRQQGGDGVKGCKGDELAVVDACSQGGGR